jgi:LmbE family N-acetylglucosaminyl deacetylase
VTSAHRSDYVEEKIQRSKKQVEAVQLAYPFATLDWLQMPTTRLETLPLNDLVKRLRSIVERVRPEIVYVPNPCDAHSDHRVTGNASLVVLKSFYLPSLGVRRVLVCEVLSETDAAPPFFSLPFQPNVFVDIGDTLERKIEIFSLYSSEIHADPLPRSASAIRAQARVRGASMGLAYAEAFMLVHELQ